MSFAGFQTAYARAFAVVLTSLLGLSPVVAEAVTPESAKVARVPHSVKALDLSKDVSTDDIMAAGQLGGQLFPTRDVRNKDREKLINRSFGEAIDQWNRHEYKNAVKLFKKHVEDYPDSPWIAEVDLHVGCDATYNGRYSEAEASFRKILKDMAGRQHEGAKVMVAKTKSRLAVLNVYRNNYDDAKSLFGELITEEGADWRDRTYASHWIQRLSRDTANKLALLNCGVLALAHLLEKDGRAAEARQVRELLPQTMLGHSISDLSSIAMRYGFPMTGLRLTAADLTQLPLPAIMHIGTGLPGEKGHYWVLESVGKDTLVLYDPQAGRKFFQGTGEFLKEWSGVSLAFSGAFSGKKNLPGQRLLDTEMDQLFGGCCGVKRPENDLGAPCETAGPGSGCSGCSKGAPVWSVNMLNLNFFVTDTPLWYQPTIGPSVKVSVSYNSQSTINQHEPFGNKWQFNYGTYLVVDTGGQVTVFMPDGRRDQYSPNGSGGYTRPAQVFNTLTKIAENHFELAFPDGTVHVYNIPANTTSLQPFLVEIRDVHGQKLTFGYNSNVQLTIITDAAGKTTTLTYNQQGLVTQATDPFGRSAHFEYDADRNLTKLTDMGGYWTSLAYDDNIYLTSLQDARGQRTFYIEPADGINNGSITYPAPGDAMFENYRITVTNPQGGKEEYYYEAVIGYGWYVSPRDYVDYVDEGASNYSPSVPKTRYNYNSTVARGAISTITHPGGGQIVYGYDSNGNKTSINNGAGTAYYAYNAQGSVTSVTDPKGAVTTIAYAANGVDPTQTQNTLGTVTMAYNAARQVTSITDRLGKTTGFSYDEYGKLTAATDPLSQTTTLSYNADHQLQQVSRGGQITDTYTYDTVGRVRTHTDTAGITLTYDYNNLDKVTKVTYPDGKFETTTYSDCCPHLVDTQTDRAGRWVSYVYDSVKRLTDLINPDSSRFRFSYDANGNMTVFNDANNNATSFEYTLDNQRAKKTDAAGKAVTTTYDAAGRLTRRTNARGITTNYAYDAGSNLTSITYSDGTSSVTFQYDTSNRLTRRTDAVGTTIFGYDANSRLTSVDGPWANDTITYGYDALGRLSSMAPQGGRTIGYTYDAMNRLTQIQQGSDTFTYGYTGASPLVQSLTRPNGSVTEYQYNTSLKQLTAQINKKSTTEIINSYAYEYNGPNPDLKSKEMITNGVPINSISAGATAYTPNILNQTAAATNPNRTYLYDDDGNMTQGYTPEGYVLTMAYDAENRMKSAVYTDGNGIQRRTEYVWSGDDLLAEVKKFSNGMLTKDMRYIRAGFLPVQERDASNTATREYTWGLNLGGGIGGLLNLRQGGSDYAYLYDGKGNVTAVIDGTQSVAAAYAYDPFGMLIRKSGTLDQPFLFSTKEYDVETGHIYSGYRFYNPILAKWTTKDPLEEAGGVNLYGFVGGNPVNWVDPKGLFLMASQKHHLP